VTLDGLPGLPALTLPGVEFYASWPRVTTSDCIWKTDLKEERNEAESGSAQTLSPKESVCLGPWELNPFGSAGWKVAAASRRSHFRAGARLPPDPRPVRSRDKGADFVESKLD